VGYRGLIGIQWGHEEKHWLKEVYSQDTSAFPNSLRANLDLWKEGLIAKIFDISKEGKGILQKVPATNNALKYFGVNAHKLWEVVKYLVPLINPMKSARVTGKMANSVVALYLGKKVSWARVLEEVIGNQVRLLGPNNL
jgi:hypothetical protein